MSDERPEADETKTADQPAEETTAPITQTTPDPDGTMAQVPEEPGQHPPGQAQEETPSSSGELSATTGEAAPSGARSGRTSVAGVLIGVLLALLGFTLVVQFRSNAGDAALASAREGDLLQIMSDLDAAERRLRQDIAALEQTKRELQSGAAGRDAALAEARERANTLGILAGTLKARGPGLMLSFFEQTGKIKAGTLLDAVQELRGAGAEALQIDGGGGSVRIVASTSFVDAEGGGVIVDGTLLKAPYTVRAIGDATTMRVALEIGVKATVDEEGGTVIVDQLNAVEINEIRSAPDLEYARPVR